MPPPEDIVPAARMPPRRPSAPGAGARGAAAARAGVPAPSVLWAARLFVLLACGMLATLAAVSGWSARAGSAMALAFIALAAGFGHLLLARIRAHEAAQRDGARLAAEYRLLAENASDMVTRVNADMTRTYVSPASRALLGYAPEELIGQTPHFSTDPRDWKLIDAAQATLADPDGPAQAVWQYRARRREGTTIWVEACGKRIEGEDGYVVTVRDISAHKAAEQRLEELTRQDALTGLANRRAFDEALAAEYRRAARSGTGLALIMLDVDHFKSFNDRYGHPAGDACLKAIAAAMVGAARRPADMCARTGGEEFAILLTETDIDGALHVAGLIGVAIAARGIRHEGSPVGVATASAGVAAVLPARTPGSPEALVRAADAALYEAKRQGRNATRAASPPFNAAFAGEDAPAAATAARHPVAQGSAPAQDAMAFVRGIFRFGKDGGCDRD